MRLRKLVLMLSSESDGEIVSAVRALGRELQKQGRDWHWLAGRLDGDLLSSSTAPRREASANGRPFTKVSLETAIMYCHNNTYRMQRKHREFVLAMWTAYLVGGRQLGGRLTTAQEKYLRDLYHKYGGKK